MLVARTISLPPVSWAFELDVAELDHESPQHLGPRVFGVADSAKNGFQRLAVRKLSPKVFDLSNFGGSPPPFFVCVRWLGGQPTSS